MIAREQRIALPLLDRIRIAAPCPMRWEEMEGDDRIRRCGACGMNVHNIARLSEGEVAGIADRLVRGERVCGVLYRRPDGMVMTEDCPRGLAAVRGEARLAVARMFAGFGLLFGLYFGVATVADARGGYLRTSEPFASIVRWLRGGSVDMDVLVAGSMGCETIADDQPRAANP